MFKRSIKKQRRPFSWRRFLIKLCLFGTLACLIFYIAASVTGLYAFTTVYKRKLGPLNPASYNLNYSEVSLPAAEDNLTIRGWFIKGWRPAAVIIVHGKDGNRSGMLDWAAPLAEDGFNILLIDMRGHGQSGGGQHSFGQYEQRDILGAVNYLKNQGYSSDQIGLMAVSLGAATGIIAMSRTQDIRAMVADSAFADLGPLLEQVFPYATGGLVPQFLLPGMLVSGSFLRGLDVSQVRPVEAIKKLNGRPLFLIHGEKDKLVPLSQHLQLVAAVNATQGPADSWIIPGAGHIQGLAREKERYLSRLKFFFERNLKPASCATIGC